MEGDRFFYLMVVVIALIGVGLFAIPVRAHGKFPLAAVEAASNANGVMERQSQSSITLATSIHAC
jgi:hypothetical protein